MAHAVSHYTSHPQTEAESPRPLNSPQKRAKEEQGCLTGARLAGAGSLALDAGAVARNAMAAAGVVPLAVSGLGITAGAAGMIYAPFAVKEGMEAFQVASRAGDVEGVRLAVAVIFEGLYSFAASAAMAITHALAIAVETAASYGNAASAAHLAGVADVSGIVLGSLCFPLYLLVAGIACCEWWIASSLRSSLTAAMRDGGCEAAALHLRAFIDDPKASAEENRGRLLRRLGGKASGEALDELLALAEQFEKNEVDGASFRKAEGLLNQLLEANNVQCTKALGKFLTALGGLAITGASFGVSAGTASILFAAINLCWLLINAGALDWVGKRLSRSVPPSEVFEYLRTALVRAEARQWGVSDRSPLFFHEAFNQWLEGQEPLVRERLQFLKGKIQELDPADREALDRLMAQYRDTMRLREILEEAREESVVDRLRLAVRLSSEKYQRILANLDETCRNRLFTEAQQKLLKLSFKPEFPQSIQSQLDAERGSSQLAVDLPRTFVSVAGGEIVSGEALKEAICGLAPAQYEAILPIFSQTSRNVLIIQMTLKVQEQIPEMKDCFILKRACNSDSQEFLAKEDGTYEYRYAFTCQAAESESSRVVHSFHVSASYILRNGVWENPVVEFKELDDNPTG